MNFLIQTINKKVRHDFSFTLLDSIEYQNWLSDSNSFRSILSDNTSYKNCIPVGSVEFVSEYLLKYFGLTPKPINIPLELLSNEWTGRTVVNGTEKDIVGEKFVKSNDKIKSFTEICTTAPIGNYQISDLIDIDSEWRAFVFKGELVGLKNYSGEFNIFPDVSRIEEMIKIYRSQPIAFTLDVAISNRSTVIMEVHDFFSCGLYGFSEHKILPFMFSKWFNEFVNKK